jgi:hypothetical protein
VPETRNERRRGQGLGTTIKYMHGAAGIGLAKAIKYLQRTKKKRRGQKLGPHTRTDRGTRPGVGL